EIEGKFGQAKKRFGMNRIRTRNYQSSLCKIGLIALALNLWKILRDFLWRYTLIPFQPHFTHIKSFFKMILAIILEIKPLKHQKIPNNLVNTII
ncbi:MAG: hypothetical protein ACK5H1_02975, partial [Tenacibaculum sp.]